MARRVVSSATSMFFASGVTEEGPMYTDSSAFASGAEAMEAFALPQMLVVTLPPLMAKEMTSPLLMVAPANRDLNVSSSLAPLAS